MKFTLAVIVVVSLTGCSRVGERDLYGTYTLDFPFAHETLVLHENGSYEQTLVVANPVDTVRQAGTWEYSAEYGNIALHNGLRLTDVSCELDSAYNRPCEGYLLRSIIKYLPWDNIELTTACEEAFYTRQPDE